MATFKLIAVNSLQKALKAAVDAKRNVTISALFHGLVSSNVAFAADMRKEDAADFDVVLRVLLPIRYNKEARQYQFDQKKAFASAEKLGLMLEAVRAEYRNADKAAREQIVQDFYSLCMSYYDDKATEAKSNSLDADALRDSAFNRVKSSIKNAKEKGVTDAALVELLIAQGVDVRGILNAEKATA
ncbi:gp3 [Shigella phage Buco]|uniref:Uncharacterized protein n=1 Tax=Shigella phage Buco TaxID=2530183 RepID=A0A482JJK9_9CAUD|nr:gp3 [Shigella phage Buco]QBP32903.1 hypothetical protein HRP29_gp3 [Shigella phage Buco]